MGWEISQPIQATDKGLPEPHHRSTSDGQSWESFIAKLARGDVLRPVRNNAGIGYAIVREGILIDMFLVTIF
jgi:hypothetical protein